MKHEELSLCVFIDALGWQILQRHCFLNELMRVKAPLETIFGYSSACDPTILTGKRPQEHGHFSFFLYDPKASPFRICRFLYLLPQFITRRGRIRRIMSRAIGRYYGYTGYFQIYNMPFQYLPLFDYSEKRDINRPGGINNGQPTVFDCLREQQIPFHFSDWRQTDAENFAQLEIALNDRTIAFAYLFLGELDAILHTHGTQAPSVSDKICWYEQKLRHIMEVADRNYRNVRMYVFSDHGMTDVIDTCDLIGKIGGLNLRFGHDYAAVYDSTMARFWFLNDRARTQIVDTLSLERKGRILDRAQLAKYGCDFAANRYGELFFLMDPGILICPSFMGDKPIAGMHGFAPEHRDSTASFMSNVQCDPMPLGLEDLHGLMLQNVLGLSGNTSNLYDKHQG